MARERVTFEQYKKAVADATKAGKKLFVEARTASKTSSGISLFGVSIAPKPRRICMEHVEALGAKYVEAFFANDKIEIVVGAE